MVAAVARFGPIPVGSGRSATIAIGRARKLNGSARCGWGASVIP
jgi:hypothetical protein